MKFGKKGNAITDTAFILVVLFVFGLIASVGYNIFSDLNDDIQADDTLSNESKQISDDLHTNYPGLFDGLFILGLILLWIASIIFSFFVDTHPLFLVITIIFMIFILLLGAYMSNVYVEILGSGDLASTNVAFPMTNFVMNHLVETMIIILGSIMLALYAKNR